MFESILFRQQRRFDVLSPLDLNSFLEALLFYQSVTLIADKTILQQLFRQLGHEFLTRLVEEKFLKIVYLNGGPAIHTTGSGSLNELHSPILYNLPAFDFDRVVRDLFIETVGKQGRGRRLATRFENKVEVVSLEKDLINQISNDFSDSKYVENSVKKILRYYTPEFENIDSLVFGIQKNGDSLLIDTNIDFNNLNRIYNSRISKSHSSMSAAYLLSHLFTVRSDIHFSSTYKTEIATDDLNSELMSLKYIDVIERRNFNSDTIRSFEEFTLQKIPDFATLILSGAKTANDFLILIEDSQKFRNWLKDKDIKSELIQEYYQSVVSQDWIDRTPVKTMKWLTFTGLGLGTELLTPTGLGAAVGLGLSLADTFLLDNLLRGWKPQHFVSKMDEFTK